MMKENGLSKLIIILGLTIVSLIGISFIPGKTEIVGIEIKRVDVLEDIKEEPKVEEFDFDFEDDTELENPGDANDSTNIQKDLIDSN